VVSIASLGIYKRIRYIEDLQETHINDLEQYQRAIDKSSLVSITDNEGYIIYVNDRLCETTGFRKDEIIGKSYIDIAHPDTPESMYTELIETVLKGKIWKGILKNITTSGGYFYQESTVTPFKEKDGSIQKYICISHDVTEVFENKSKLQQSLHLDTLTGLGNRARLIAVLNNAHSANLALLDIDKFHQINETFGMKRGDRLLKDFSERLSKHNQIKNYQFFRIHSDVFAAISLSSAPDAFISNIESAIADITKTTFSIKDQEIILQLKIGHSHGAQNNLAHADAALQFAKTNNMDSFSYDSSVLNKTDVYERHTRVVKMLSNAIEDDRIVPYFQPIKGCISAANKYECLIRLIDEDKSVISPAEFLDISKQTRFYPVLTKIMVKKSIDYFANHPAEFSINLSPQDITNTETMNFIFKYAVDNGVMKKMILEIVESEEFSKSDEVESLLSRFKNAGARIAIDDFGSGYSNFDYLIKIKADFIKIDGGITKLINKDSRAKDIAQSIVSYAKKLNMQTIAEFVSDEELAQATKEMGIDFQQGYYIGKPDKEAK
jgi:PAS domain S-box-containing protein/diguanylate cyclase (GGDEF)-like protein